ncbi:hypothetical protein SCOCK_140179 [Actinacidiphila cocklensis]|uniref:Uncharacterized protein n=1 Tax=Actinacidiphila cocklensis TaxID=887465 RepID=A0A9W4DIH4_9ACTN|nr:hypothetical protein SCOCK_140179 [Actinacidiphila cocklensis]
MVRSDSWRAIRVASASVTAVSEVPAGMSKKAGTVAEPRSAGLRIQRRTLLWPKVSGPLRERPPPKATVRVSAAVAGGSAACSPASRSAAVPPAAAGGTTPRSSASLSPAVRSTAVGSTSAPCGPAGRRVAGPGGRARGDTDRIERPGGRPAGKSLVSRAAGRFRETQGFPA